MSHLLRCGTGRAGLGAPGTGAGPHITEGPWPTEWSCTEEGLRTRRELLGSAGRGFCGGLGFSSSCISKYIQLLITTRGRSHTTWYSLFGFLPPSFQAHWQPCWGNTWCERLSGFSLKKKVSFIQINKTKAEPQTSQSHHSANKHFPKQNESVWSGDKLIQNASADSAFKNPKTPRGGEAWSPPSRERSLMVYVVCQRLGAAKQLPKILSEKSAAKRNHFHILTSTRSSWEALLPKHKTLPGAAERRTWWTGVWRSPGFVKMNAMWTKCSFMLKSYCPLMFASEKKRSIFFIKLLKQVVPSKLTIFSCRQNKPKTFCLNWFRPNYCI